jgi:hypothetical protein
LKIENARSFTPFAGPTPAAAHATVLRPGWLTGVLIDVVLLVLAGLTVVAARRRPR